jgi:hypothetical protein
VSGTQQYVNPNAVYASGLTCLTTFPPAYVFQQYADDDNIWAWFTAYNQIAEQYLLWFNTLNLPIYTGGIVSGALLDWVALGIYGMVRPSVTTGSTRSLGAMATLAMSETPMAWRTVTSTETLQSTTDDIFRRMMTWNLYKGDGFVFNVEWLKRRVLRFVNGPNGISPVIDNTFSVSVSMSGNVFTVLVTTTYTSVVTLLNALIQSGACATPFQYSFSVSIPINYLADDGGVLIVLSGSGYPTSTSGLVAGSIWSNGGNVSVVPGVLPNPFAPPVYFGSISSSVLLALGGGNLPLISQSPGSGQLWNNGGEVSIS